MCLNAHFFHEILNDIIAAYTQENTALFSQIFGSSEL